LDFSRLSRGFVVFFPPLSKIEEFASFFVGLFLLFSS